MRQTIQLHSGGTEPPVLIELTFDRVADLRPCLLRNLQNSRRSGHIAVDLRTAWQRSSEKISNGLFRPCEECCLARASPLNHLRRLYGEFDYQAGSWDKPRRVLGKTEWHAGELFPR